MNIALKLKVIKDNPCKYVERPKREKFKPEILDIRWSSGKHIHPMYYTNKIGKVAKIAKINKTIRFHDIETHQCNFNVTARYKFKSYSRTSGT